MDEIIYRSLANTFPESELEQLLHKARIFNKSKEITGLLIYFQGHFVQLLEGQKDHLLDLFHNKICKDPRHHQIEIISEKEIPFRRCHNWDMAYIRGTPERAGMLDDFIGSIDDYKLKKPLMQILLSKIIASISQKHASLSSSSTLAD